MASIQTWDIYIHFLAAAKSCSFSRSRTKTFIAAIDNDLADGWAHCPGMALGSNVKILANLRCRRKIVKNHQKARYGHWQETKWEIPI
jgi:hypothetical protein